MVLNHHLGGTWCCSDPINCYKRCFVALKISVRCKIVKEEMNGVEKRML